MKCKPNAKSDWRAALAGYWRDQLANTDEPLRLDTGRILGRIHRQGILSGMLDGIHRQSGSPVDPAKYPARAARQRIPPSRVSRQSSWPVDPGLWWDTRRDPLASYSGGILGGIHWRATLGYSAGYSAGSRDPLTSRSGGILGGIHWRAALAGYSAGSTGELL